jgi:glycosyltransferase involved in cell wall biosynthesis
MAAVVKNYNIGDITDSIDPEILAEKINEALHNQRKRKVWAENLPKAAAELNWEKEEKIIQEIYSRFLSS